MTANPRTKVPLKKILLYRRTYRLPCGDEQGKNSSLSQMVFCMRDLCPRIRLAHSDLHISKGQRSRSLSRIWRESGVVAAGQLVAVRTSVTGALLNLRSLFSPDSLRCAQKSSAVFLLNFSGNVPTGFCSKNSTETSIVARGAQGARWHHPQTCPYFYVNIKENESEKKGISSLNLPLSAKRFLALRLFSRRSFR